MDYSLKTSSQLRPILVGFRKAAGLTQAMVASRLGVTQQTYAQLEADPAVVSVERLFKVLRVLGVELALTHATPSRASSAKEAVRLAPPPAAAKDTSARSRRAPLKVDATPAPRTARKRSTTASAKKRENW